jgi:hypothetical protein
MLFFLLNIVVALCQPQQTKPVECQSIFTHRITTCYTLRFHDLRLDFFFFFFLSAQLDILQHQPDSSVDGKKMYSCCTMSADTQQQRLLWWVDSECEHVSINNRRSGGTFYFFFCIYTISLLSSDISAEDYSHSSSHSLSLGAFSQFSPTLTRVERTPINFKFIFLLDDGAMQVIGRLSELLLV